MFGEKIETTATARRHTAEVTDPTEISRLLGELAERKEQLFISEVGANLSFAAEAIAVDARRRVFRISAAANASGPGIRAGTVFEVFVPIRNADLVFATRAVHPVSGKENAYDLAMPARLRLWHRREHPRGPCFGLVEVIIRRKDPPHSKDLTATLRDISNAGLGISLPEGMAPGVRAGDAFDDCVLLLNNKPMAVCAIEVLHARNEPQTGRLIAGGRFANLDDVAKTRIAKLIAALDPLWGEPPPPTVD